MSFYEFTQPAEKRLTDWEWAQMLYSGGTIPERPSWLLPLVEPTTLP